ncbi:hypothetical protein [Clostridium haemolyticum]|nr:hypothetical protein [Clostridium haemolyticum]
MSILVAENFKQIKQVPTAIPKIHGNKSITFNSFEIFLAICFCEIPIL